MALTKRERDRVLVRFYDAQDHYERLASEVRRLLDEESPYLANALYTVKHRLKDRDRLIQKIDQQNARLRKGGKRIDLSNFPERIEDLLGIRIVCLRLSDLAKVKRYLGDLADDGKIKVVRGPIEKKTFLIRPGDPEAARDLQYSGYSSVHYVIKLGKVTRPVPQIANLKAELQLRTLFEEAWGEIDHKYRYELKRAGQKVPPHVDAGFRDLALYLQAAARHVEHLCEDIERLRTEPKSVHRRAERVKSVAPTTAAAPALTAGPALTGVSAHSLTPLFQRLLGFQPTLRTLGYLQQRLNEHGYHIGRSFTENDLERHLDADVLNRFTQIYREVMNKPPFQEQVDEDRDIDVIPLVNFAIFSTVQSRGPAEAGLRATLRRRMVMRGY
jgi:putative GTP pyrophosphokinase